LIIEANEVKRRELPVNKIIHGNVLEVLKKLPDESVDCVITSPPYWGKRDYGEETCTIWGGNPNCEHEWELEEKELDISPSDKSKLCNGRGANPKLKELKGAVKSGFCKKCGAWYGQLGLEPTPEMFIDHLIEIFREVKRVLKPHGNVFINIDDTYSGHMNWTKKWQNKNTWCPDEPIKRYAPVPQKSLCLVPELFAIRMVYDLGFILRNKIIWAKKVHIYKDRTTIGNAMPESVKDRLCHTHEVVYHFVKKPKYYYDLDAVRIPHKESSKERVKYPVNAFGGNPNQLMAKLTKGKKGDSEITKVELNPLGANPGDVIQINTEPFPEAHFAVFPTKLVEFLIKVGCPEQVCKKCGKPREKIVEKGEIISTGGSDRGKWAKSDDKNVQGKKMIARAIYTIGWTDCGCGAGFEPGIVLDPFGGSGTTALVALQMARRFILIELNREYCEMALRRIKPYLTQQRLNV